MQNPGWVEFELGGQKLHFEAFKAKAGEVWIVFRDGTSGRQTYGAARFLYAQVHEDGSVTLDFNRAYNPPCAFTAFATCPLPPVENRISLPIPAGELYTG